jgi:N-acetylmuramoyl-L-alanine amidase
MKSRYETQYTGSHGGDSRLIRRREIAIIAATAVTLAGVAVYLHSPEALRLEGRTASQAKGTGLTATAIDPSKFATGACMEFTPQGGASRDETVFIDAGHGGIDPGGTGQTESGSQVTESAVNLPIEMDAMRVLTADGYRVVVSRTEQTTVIKLGPGDTDGKLLTVTGTEDDIAARDECANLAHADLLVGIYMNAGGPGNAGSVTGYDTARPFAQDNLRFANLLQADVLTKLNAAGNGIPNGGVQDDSQLGSTLSAAGAAYGHLMLLGPAYPPGGFTDPSDMPGALIEPLFLSDPFEASIADSSQGQQLIAGGIADAVGQYFTSSAAPGATPAPSGA